MARKEIKKPKQTKSSKLTVLDVPNYDKVSPIFSLEKIVGDKYCFSKLDVNGKSQFSESIYRRRTLTWNAIKSTSRHGLGFEKIPRNAIKGTIPLTITEDLTEFLVFRYNGMHPMVGYREKNVFFVLWFDHDFTLYNHG